MLRNSPGQHFQVVAFNTSGRVSGDAANITATLSIDGGTRSATDDVNPTEIGTSGEYLFDLATAETHGHALSFSTESSTPGVQVLGMPSNVIYTTSPVGGEYLLTVTVRDENSIAIAGAIVTIQNEDDEVIAVGRTAPTGKVVLGVDAGDYTVITSAGILYTTDVQEITITANAPLSATLTGSPLSPADPTQQGPIFRVDTATDWELPFEIGSLVGAPWTKIVFTAKVSPVEEDSDDEAMIQVAITNGGDASDGLIRINRAAPSGGLLLAHAAIENLDTATGIGVVKIRAIATEKITPTNQDFWESTDDQLTYERGYRINSITDPPVLHWDVKRIDDDGKASPNRQEGLLVVAQAVTQRVT